MKLIIFYLLLFFIILINYVYCNHDYGNFPNKFHNNYPMINDKHKIKYEMMLHIKNVLHMERENRTLDEYVKKIFNLDNPNPNYIFVLPDVHNKTIVFKRSDFMHAVFPNVTSQNKFKRNSDYNLSTFYKNINNTLKGERYGPQLQLPPVPDLYDTNDEDLSQLHNEKLVNNFYDDQIDEETRKIVAENVRTERNFLRFMDELNKNAHLNRNTWPNDGKNQDKNVYANPWSAGIGLNRNKNNNLPLQANIQNEQVTSGVGREDDWDLLGLSGWSGGLKVVHDDFSENYASSTSSNIFTNPGKLVQYQNNYGGLKPPAPPQQPPQQKPIKSVNPLQQQKEQIKQLTIINDNLNYNNQRDNTNNINKPKFPVTSPRAQHKDDDVFIARANDPFGHSTKWSNISEQQSHRDGRSKRGVIQLYSMIKCTTGCDPLIYKGYGCYCGFLGSGRALDGIDRCCKMHDYCYSVSGCPMFLEYFVPYLWKCYRGRPLCALDHGEWGGPGSCASRLCECDRVLSKCLRRYLCPRKRNVCTASPFRLFQNFVMDLTDI